MNLEDGSVTEGCPLMVASGNHLTQVLTFRPRIATGPMGSVTYVGASTPDAGNDLQLLVTAHPPTTKHLGNSVRNYGLASMLMDSRRTEWVISTGAAVAVPFVMRAAQLGIPCAYIESATWVDGPSLSGRNHQYRQLYPAPSRRIRRNLLASIA